jgi:hypothetical protein
MRKFSILLLILLFTVYGNTKTVNIGDARLVADNYISYFGGKINIALRNSFSVQYNGITVYHVFNYIGGGFVVIAADDAVIPVLAQSNEGYIDQNISNPNAKYWFDSYSKEIGQLLLLDPITPKHWNNGTIFGTMSSTDLNLI